MSRALLTRVILALVLLSSLQPVPARAEETIPSNLGLLERLTRDAVADLVGQLTLAPGQAVTILTRSPHEGNAFVQERLSAALAARGFRVVAATSASADTSGEEPDDAELPAPAEGDSLGSAREPAPAAPLEVATGSVLPTGRYPEGTTLDLTLLEFGVRYVEPGRRYLVGPVVFTRIAGVYLQVAELAGGRGEVKGVITAERHHWDRVTGRERLLAEGSSYPFARPELRAPGLGRYIEPAVVLGVVGGLIFLFYENQN